MTQDHSEETSIVSDQQRPSMFGWIRDRLYDIVYQEGDFALQMVGDLFRGYEPSRENRHLERQIEHRETRVTSSTQPSKKNTKKPNQKSKLHEKPLTYIEKQAFVDFLKRENGEGQIEYWKRKKWLLSLPNSTIREMLEIHSEIKKQIITETVDVEANSIAHSYQQRLAERKARKQMKSRVLKRTQKRGRTR